MEKMNTFNKIRHAQHPTVVLFHVFIGMEAYGAEPMH